MSIQREELFPGIFYVGEWGENRVIFLVPPEGFNKGKTHLISSIDTYQVSKIVCNDPSIKFRLANESEIKMLSDKIGSLEKIKSPKQFLIFN